MEIESLPMLPSLKDVVEQSHSPNNFISKKDRMSSLFKLSHINMSFKQINVEKIVDSLRNMTGKEIIFNVCQLFKEENVNYLFFIFKRQLMEKVFVKLEKDLFLAIVEKTLKIQNEGGMSFSYSKKSTVSKNADPQSREFELKQQEDNYSSGSGSNCNEIIILNSNVSYLRTKKKSLGGIFFTLVKKEGNFSKEDIKILFKNTEDKKMAREKNKLIKLFQKNLYIQ